MNIIKKILPMDCNIFEYGDTHEGSLLFYEKGFDQLIDMMHSEYDGLPASRNFGIDMGDAIEGITVDDRRYDGVTNKGVRGVIYNQVVAAVKRRKPIAKKILSFLKGNHENAVWKHMLAAEIMAEQLGVDFGDRSCTIRLSNSKGKQMFNIYASHLNISINSKIPDPVDRQNSLTRSLMRALFLLASDCIVMSSAHIHKLIVREPIPDLCMSTEDGIKQHYTETDQTSGQIDPYQRWYVGTGCFLRTLGDGFCGYGEVAGYAPLQLGCAVVLVRGGKVKEVRKVHFK